MIQFTDVAGLRSWLIQNGIEVGAWGQGASKRVEDLWREYIAGEATFEDDPPRRLIHAANVIIRRQNLVLREAEQEFANGQRRCRDLFPSEKIKPGETTAAAALRCLREELGVAAERVALDLSSQRQTVETIESGSYPGLQTCYTIHTIEAAVSGLPDTDFWHENITVDKDSDPIRRHRWTWVEA